MSLHVFDPEPRAMQLSDGTIVAVVGDTSLWSISANTDPSRGLNYSSTLCLMATLEVLGKPPCKLPPTIPLRDLEESLRRCGLETVCHQARSHEDLAMQIELGRVVMLLLNAGILWNSPQKIENGQANHVVIASAVARDAEGNMVACFLRDPLYFGLAETQLGFVKVRNLEEAWLRSGGFFVAASNPEEV